MKYLQNAADFLKDLFSVSTEQQVFVIAILAFLVIGFALYVVLVALKSAKSGTDHANE